VNAVNVSELKAIIAHEFGHFSQRSMKLGSWVYQVNKIIHDMLYNNQGYATGLDSVGNVHGIFSLFAALTVQVIKGIQWVLRQIYKVVNKSYLGLSRQMEFHADLVAASVCGSNNIIGALRRAEFGDACYNTTLELCGKAWKEKKIVEDFYTDHSVVVKSIAGINQMLLEGGLPVVKVDSQGVVYNRVNYKNQWASHPTLQERADYLEPFGLTAGVDQDPAWILFNDADKWKVALTRQLYKAVPAEEVQAILDHKSFETLLEEQITQFSFPDAFKEYYNEREVALFDTEAVIKEPFADVAFEDLLSDEAAMLPKKLRFLTQDIAVLNAIGKKEIVVRSFDFDGQKYLRGDATVILAQLESELAQQQKNWRRWTRSCFNIFILLHRLPLPAHGCRTTRFILIIEKKVLDLLKR
jgi:hypothetical protein